MPNFAFPVAYNKTYAIYALVDYICRSTVKLILYHITHDGPTTFAISYASNASLKFKIGMMGKGGGEERRGEALEEKRR